MLWCGMRLCGTVWCDVWCVRFGVLRCMGHGVLRSCMVYGVWLEVYGVVWHVPRGVA